MRRHLRSIAFTLGGRWDLLWCFEPDAYPDLRWFDARARLYHVVDQIMTPAQALVGRHADLTIAVSPSIAARLHAPEQKVLVIPHGLSSEFAAYAREALRQDEYCPGQTINVGYSGNLWIHSLDRSKLRTIITDHPEVIFHFWGPVRSQDSNVGAMVTSASRTFVQFLESAPNVQLHGVVSGSELPAALSRMDALLLCYDLKADQNTGANSHKILEYLATGRVVVGNRVSDFANRPAMIEAPEDDTDAAYSALFARTLASLRDLNSERRRRERLLFALERTYEAHILKVEALMRARGVA
jgi:glycosyltransferase involved in cell wall biosynthesis